LKENGGRGGCGWILYWYWMCQYVAVGGGRRGEGGCERHRFIN